MSAAAFKLPRDIMAENVMLSAAGRRVALMKLLEQSMADLNIHGGVLATDLHAMSPAMQLARETALVPPYRDPNCLDFLLQLCEQYRIRLIVPTIDPELVFYTEHRTAFANIGCQINVSDSAAIDISFDKLKTHDWLTQNDLPRVRQATLSQVLAGEVKFELPVIIKPRRGSSSIGITIARTFEQLQTRGHEADLLVQSIATGREYTVDVFVDRDGRCRCAVPRRRIETRGGEVSKGVTVRNRDVMDLAWQVAETLPGAYGVMNIQIFHDAATNQLAVIEINPRFGGGYPLSEQAGAPMTRWLLEDVLKLPSTSRADMWREGVVMLRYDAAVFVEARDAGLEL
jgi:carbamoyl-phosphate synthase large subunit